MLVRLWAGPSCIARAISRRRSSWAFSSILDTAAGIGAPCPGGPDELSPAPPGVPASAADMESR